MGISKFAVCLYQEEFTDLNSKDLIVGQDLKRIKVKKAKRDTTEFVIYQRHSPPQIAKWIEIVEKFGELDSDFTDSFSAGAILIIKSNSRVFGCCFGSSVANINRNNIVHDFGLGTAFKRISKDQTKAIESFALLANPITSNRSSAKATTKDLFNLDTFLENITELSGFVRSEKNIKNLVKGKEFYSSPAPKTLPQIKKLCADLLRDYNLASKSDEYKRLTATKKIKDKREIDELNKELFKRLKKKDSQIALIDYEMLDDITYRLYPQGKDYPYLSIKDFYEDSKIKDEIDLKYLKNRSITAISLNGLGTASWPLYKCIFAEIKDGNNSIILFRGIWYQIQGKYLDGLRSFIKDYEIDNATDFLPEWDGQQVEKDYNNAAAAHVGGQCWDRLLYVHTDYSYGIEFCDILTKDYIIHVKEGSSSSLNSHLLLQTFISAKLLKEDVAMKKWIRKISSTNFKKNILLKTNGSLKNSNITYWMILLKKTNKQLSDSLPFFSLISFNHMIKQIELLGFNIKIGTV
jgi:uncharacterized protein (TIGR04141 family)